MPQHWKNRIHKLQSILIQSKQTFLCAQQHVRHAITATGYWSVVLVVGIGIAGVILHVSGVPVVEPAEAGFFSTVTLFFINILYIAIILPIGLVAVLIAFLLDIVIGYPYDTTWWDNTTGGFVNIAAVQNGWRLVRDISNMFFALLLVIIALATVLKIEAYSWKQMLPKLILNAVLINFSKSIAGVFTDFATVAMATFGGQFAGGIGKAMLTNFGLGVGGSFSGFHGVEQVDNQDATDTGAGTLILAFVAGAIMVVVFAVVALVFLVTLIFRILMLWFLIVLSPLAYITRILPQTEKYSHQWWEMFGRYVVVGPLVTFFLWLSMMIAFDETVHASPFSEDSLKTITDQRVSKPPETVGDATSPNNLARYTIGIMMLLASLKLINQMAAEAGTITGKVESAAWGAALRITEKSGQVIGGRASKWGVAPPAQGEEDTRTGWQKAVFQVGNMGALLGSTAMQPVSWGKRALHNIQESSNKNQEEMRGDVMTRLGSMRSQDIGGHGFWKGALGGVNNLAGVLGGVGMEDGEHIFEEYISFNGAKRMLNRLELWSKYGDDLEVDENGETSFDRHVREAKEESDNAKKRFTVEELKKNATVFDRLVEAISNLTQEMGKVDSNDPGAELYLSFPYMAAAAEEQIKRLKDEADGAAAAGDNTKAKQRMQQSKALQTALDNKEEFYLDEFLTKFTGDDGADALRSNIKDAMSVHQQSLEAEQKEIKESLTATGVTDGRDYDPSGKLDIYNPDGTLKVQLNLSSDEQRKESFLAFRTADQHRAHVLSEFGATEAGMSYEARQYKQKLVGEEMDKLRDIKNTDELMVYFGSAIHNKNQHMIEALLRRITQNGDENEIFQEWLAGHMDDPEVKRLMAATVTENERGEEVAGLQPSSGAAGGELFRKAFLQAKLGMTTEESIRVMSDVSYIAEEGRHYGMARKYGSSAGRWQIRTENQQLDSLKAENRKKDIGDVLRGNRLLWGDEIGRGRTLQITESGWNELLSRGDALGADRIWERWDTNAKLNLSKPEVTAKMAQKGINPKLVQKLKQYWITTGQYVEAEDWQKNKVLRKFA